MKALIKFYILGLMVFFSAILFTGELLGQQKWARTYDGANIDYAQKILQTSDGGYIATGYTYSFGAAYGYFGTQTG